LSDSDPVVLLTDALGRAALREELLADGPVIDLRDDSNALVGLLITEPAPPSRGGA